MISINYSLGMVGAVLPPLVILFAWWITKGFRSEKRSQQAFAYHELQHNPLTAKISQWVTINQINGIDYDGWRDSDDYKVTLSTQNIKIALFAPGTYHLVVSSFSDPNLQYIPFTITVEAGRIYQLGCDSNGPYCTEEFASGIYDLSEHELDARSIAY
ncbi:hypothetical protein VQ643_10665 [Pseudomonas sp. F1_0610]|uniref:hypothetical protein n=1 Tax=Pseudomonas sp. F1_0610 TaxID=3114284 RepID=UPI0039C31094